LVQKKIHHDVGRDDLGEFFTLAQNVAWLYDDDDGVIATHYKIFLSSIVKNSLLLLYTWDMFCMLPPSSWLIPMKKPAPLHGTIQMNTWIVQLLVIGICHPLSPPVSHWTKTCVNSAFPTFKNNLSTESE